MAITLGNRIRVSTSSTGTGSITLGSSETGYQTFSAGGISDGDEVRFVITEGSAFEISKGTYTHSGTVLSRTLLESTTGALLNLQGNAKVFVTAAAEDLMLTSGGTFTDDVTFGSGPYYAKWDDSAYAFIIDKNAKLAIGDGGSSVYDQNFMIYANSVNNTYINNQVGLLNISNQGDGDIQIEAKGQFGSSKNYFVADVSTYEAQLFYNGSEKIKTASGGVTITGTATATAFSGDGSGLTSVTAATGGGSDNVFYENGQTVTTDYTITNGKNAMSAGPIAINSGVTVTVGSGETWTVV